MDGFLIVKCVSARLRSMHKVDETKTLICAPRWVKGFEVEGVEVRFNHNANILFVFGDIGIEHHYLLIDEGTLYKYKGVSGMYIELPKRFSYRDIIDAIRLQQAINFDALLDAVNEVI